MIWIQNLLLSTIFLSSVAVGRGSADSSRLATRRYSTIGTIQELKQSVGVIKDLYTGKTIYLRVGDSVPGNSSFVMSGIRKGQVSINSVEFPAEVLLPRDLNSSFDAKRKERPDAAKSLLRNKISRSCKSEARRFCDPTEDDASATFNCLIDNLDSIKSGCASLLRFSDDTLFVD